MSTQDNLYIIADDMYSCYKELHDGLPNGAESQWGYDEKLVDDIANAILRWRKRKDANDSQIR